MLAYFYSTQVLRQLVIGAGFEVVRAGAGEGELHWAGWSCRTCQPTAS